MAASSGRDRRQVLERRHQDDVGLGAALAEDAQQLETVLARHADVGQHDVDRRVREGLEAGVGAPGGADDDGVRLEGFRQRGPDSRIVVDGEEGRGHDGQSAPSLRRISSRIFRSILPSRRIRVS